MKKLFVLIGVVAGIMVGCARDEGDMSSPPAEAPATNNAVTNE